MHVSEHPISSFFCNFCFSMIEMTCFTALTKPTCAMVVFWVNSCMSNRAIRACDNRDGNHMRMLTTEVRHISSHVK